MWIRESNVDMRGWPIELLPTRTAYIEGPPCGFNVLAVKNTEVLGWLGACLVDNVSPNLLLQPGQFLARPRNPLARKSHSAAVSISGLANGKCR